MDLNKFQISQVKYNIVDVKLYIGTKAIFPVPSINVLNIYIEKDFDNEHFPYAQMTLNLPSWVHRDMQRNPTQLKISFKLQYGLFSDKKPLSATMITDVGGTFAAFIGDSGVVSNENTLIDIEKSQKQYKKGYLQNDMQTIDILILNNTFYVGKDKTTNLVLSSATPMEAITCTLNNAGYNNVLISKPSSNGVVSEMKLPPLTTMRQLNYIINYYNVFKDGAIIFFDLYRGYILNKAAKCDAWSTNEYKTVNILTLFNQNTKTMSVSGFNKDTKSKSFSISLTDGSYSFENLSNTTTISDITVLPIGGQSAPAKAKIKGSKGKGRAVYTDSYGTSIGDITKAITDMNSIFSFTTTSAVMGAMSPNKEYKVALDNTKSKELNGTYRLSNAVFTFTKEGDYFKLTTFAVLKK